MTDGHVVSLAIWTDRQAEKVRQIHDERIRQGRVYRRKGK